MVSRGLPIPIMNILYVTATDSMGQQFNGYLLHHSLKRMGHESHMAVAWRDYDEPEIHALRKGLGKYVDASLNLLERGLSLYALLPVSTLKLYYSSYYRRADILHLQLIHPMSFFSLFNVPIMSSKIPTIWTMHDPWLMNGHCVHPLECDRWLIGCGNCPDLKNLFPIKKDTTAFSWKLKQWVMAHSRVSLVVASRWMLDRVKRSPILSHLPCHLIPLGVDTTLFRPLDKSKVRAGLGIPNNAHVVACRASKNYDYKGTIYIEQAMKRLNLNGATYIITFDNKGALGSLKDKYRIIELGWVEDQQVIAEAMSAADVFLMPSIAESFGMMALESMACGTPVIAFEGTSLPTVIDAPNSGLVVGHKDPVALANVIETVLANTVLRQRLSDNCLKLVQREYTLELYVKRHLELYQSLLSIQDSKI